MPDSLNAETQLAGVTFRKLGKLHYYPAEAVPLTVGDSVVAETEDGTECGEVKILRPVSGRREDANTPFRIVRIANERDKEIRDLRLVQSAEGLKLCQEKANGLGLDMKAVEAEVSFDGHQITLYFVADSRVDFRQLVKEIAGRLKMRVHLHQVGARDHARALGGYGPCGRPLCCTTFLRDFAPVSMKMAKDQSLYLNPSKFSGVCGKLMCCLRYEHEVYMDERDKMPPLGSSVVLANGERAIIEEVNVMRQTLQVTVQDDDGYRTITVAAQSVQIARACGDCGSAGGGCGGSCGSGEGQGCGVPAKVEGGLIALERRTKHP